MADREHYISEIAALPEQLKTAVAALDDEQLDTPYRPGGWTVRQVVHHLADSHMNSYIRFKLALTEDEPVIKPYAEDQWAEIEEARRGAVSVSLTLLTALHTRW
ncbi:MAG: DinB family protein, partial [Bryobacteraceae bacterium]